MSTSQNPQAGPDRPAGQPQPPQQQFYPQQTQQYPPQYQQPQYQQPYYPPPAAPAPRKKGFPWWGWLLVVIVALVVISAVATSANKGTATATATAAPAAAQPTAAAPTAGQAATVGKIGQTMTLKGYQITVNGIEKKDNFGTSDFTKAKDGNTFIAVDLTVASTQDKGVNPNGLSATLKDGNGYKYSIKPTGYKEPLFPGQNDLPAGDKVRGWVTYEVPKNATGLVLEYTPLLDSGLVRIALD